MLRTAARGAHVGRWAGRWSQARRVLVLVTIASAAVVCTAQPALANHVVVWGAGTTCDNTAKTATAEVNGRVSFIVCTTLGGEPLPGHPMEVRVVGPTREVSSP